LGREISMAGTALAFPLLRRILKIKGIAMGTEKSALSQSQKLGNLIFA